MVWKTSDLPAAAQARLLARRLRAGSGEWSCSLDEEGLIALQADVRRGCSEVYLLPDRAGVVFGKLFRRDSTGQSVPQSTVFDASAAAALVKHGPLHMLEIYWGRYIAAIRHTAADGTWILRDPTGGLPCYLARYRGIDILFSDVTDLLCLELWRFSINWSYIAAVSAYPALQIPATGLNEVSELQPGECWYLRGKAAGRSLCWDPDAVAGSEPIENAAQAAVALRATTRDCVHAWASCHASIVHALSGGLDSSIVLACLTDATTRPQLICINHFSPGSNQDERRYARLAAARAGTDLIEHSLSASAVRLEQLWRLQRSVRPWFYIGTLQLGRSEEQTAAARAATAIFTGAGGDALFFQAYTQLAAVDCLLGHGISARLWKTAVDAARIRRSSVWRVLLQAVKIARTPVSWLPFGALDERRSLVDATRLLALREDDSLTHIWQSRAAGLPHGKVCQLRSVGISPSFYDPLGQADDPERVHPLLSQPLIELCLRIPTYVWIEGGRDRALARRAFADRLPIEILRRHSKGGIDRLSTQILDANPDFVREMLLDGLLVQERILDRRRLEACLRQRVGPYNHQYNEVLHNHLSIEAWLRSWQSAKRRAVA